MPRITENLQDRNIGLPPGTLVINASRQTEGCIVRLLDYDAASCKEKIIENLEEAYPYKDKPTVTWINVDGLHNVDVLQKLGERFELHPLTLEDISHVGQRPKTENYDNYIYIVLKMLRVDESANEIVAEQVSIVLGDNYLISFQENADGDVFDNIRERIRSDKGRVRKMREDYLAYCLIDSIVDNYFVVLDKVGDEIEKLEDQVMTDVKVDLSKRIHQLKRDLIFLRKMIAPLSDVINALQKTESKLISKATSVYLKDVYDHITQSVDTIDSSRDILLGMHYIYISSMSNHMNEIMKVLTMITTIFIPLSFIAGVYGMNFKHMPELNYPWAYPALWAVMITIALGMVIAFKRQKWL